MDWSLVIEVAQNIKEVLEQATDFVESINDLMLLPQAKKSDKKDKKED